jgi:hypothetical protein
MRYAFWRFVAQVLDLGLLTVRPSWPEIRYKINGRLNAARQARAHKALQKTVEWQQYQTWRFKWIMQQREAQRRSEVRRNVKARLKTLLSRHAVA